MSVVCTIFFCLMTTAAAAATPEFAVAVDPAPVFSTPKVREILLQSQPDDCRQIRQLEFVALPGTAFRIIGETGKGADKVYRVLTAEYPHEPKEGLFVHSAFVHTTDTPPPERNKIVPSKEVVLSRLEKMTGIPYLWGSNLPGAIPAAMKTLGGRGGSTIDGIDCSGILYFATDGFTPRNTSSLVTYGKAVPIAGLSAEQITKKLRPLDLIVWRGHMLIVLGGGRVIESRLNCKNPVNGGVHIEGLAERIRKVMKTRRPVDAGGEKGTFVIRRWFE